MDNKMHGNAVARLVLKEFYEGYEERDRDLSWQVNIRELSKLELGATVLDDALRRLVTKNALSRVSGNIYALERRGIEVWEDEALLRELFPVPGEQPSDEQSFGHTNHHGGPGLEPALMSSCASLLANEDVKRIVMRDMEELKSVLAAKAYKSTMLLSGSILEALLIDVLGRNSAVAGTYMKKKKFPDEASLEGLLSMAHAEKLLTETSGNIGDTIKGHRDLIHPHAEMRSSIVVDGTTSALLVNLLSVVVRDLNKAWEDGRIKAYVEKA